MSLILDALNRSQAERGSESGIPGIETQHWVEPVPYAGRWQRGMPWLALGLALLVIVWLLVGRNSGSEEAQAKISSLAVSQTPIEARPDPTQAMPLEPELSKVSSSENEAVALPKNSAPVTVENLAVSKPEMLQESTRHSVAVANLYSTPDVAEASVAVTPAAGSGAKAKERAIERPVAEPSQNEQAIDIEEMVKLARQEAENAELSEHSAPFLSQLSQQKKDQVPTIYYTQHDYSSTASQSSVTLNGENVRVGGSVARKIKVLEILPNSVVLSDRGTKFRLRALNSWINL